jgi:hypothetical protein
MMFGKALERILQAIVDANQKYGPVQLIKVDIVDGFYRISVNVNDITKLAAKLPPMYGDEPLLAAGPTDGMDGVTALLWHLTDDELLIHFDLTYPQTVSWRIVHPAPGMLLSVTSALRRQRPELASSFLHEPMRAHNTVEALAVISMLCIVLFFLCRPGKSTAAPTGQNAPFRLCDVTFYVGLRLVLANTATNAGLDSATFVTLTFTTQKNTVRGEVIGIGLSGDPFVCPVLSTASRVRHLLDLIVYLLQ